MNGRQHEDHRASLSARLVGLSPVLALVSGLGTARERRLSPWPWTPPPGDVIAACLSPVGARGGKVTR